MSQPDHSQIIQPQNTYKRFKKWLARAFQQLSRHNLAPLVSAQFQGAHDVNISGNPVLISTGNNQGKVITNVTNYGGVHGLENMDSFISQNAQFDSFVQDPECECHPGTRKTVLAEMHSWIDNPAATPIFWLCGPTGVGKSAIARTIARSYGRPKIAASFFFSRPDSTRNNGDRLITTLAYQLSISIPPIRDLLVKSFRERPDISMTDIETQFEALIVQPLRALNTVVLSTPAIVIIDGADECINEKLQRRFLQVICTSVMDNPIPLRFIISSRREAYIEDTINFTECPKTLLDLSHLNADPDIEIFFREKFSRIALGQGLDSKLWPGSCEIKELIHRASGQFTYASLVIEFVGNGDYSAEIQLRIVLELKPAATKSLFRDLDELYLEILKRHPDQNFLTNFLTLFVAYLRFSDPGLHKDDPLLMNMSEKEFYIKLRRMRSVIRFEPYLDVYHHSFLEFLQDLSRSGQYHIKEEVAAKKYLELITKSLVHYCSNVINNSHTHDETSHFRPQFGVHIHRHPVMAVFAVEGWQEVLQPLLAVWDNMLNPPAFDVESKFLACTECTGFRIIRFLSFNVNLKFLGETSDSIYPSSGFNAQKSSCPIISSPPLIPMMDLNSCLTSLLTHYRKLSELSMIVDLLLRLLHFDLSEAAMNIRSIPDALVLVYLIDRLTTGNYFISSYGPNAACRGFQLVSEIYSRIPILPLSLLCNIYPGFLSTELYNNPALPPFMNFCVYSDHCAIWESYNLSNITVWRTPFTSTSKILGHNCVIPVLWIYDHIDSTFIPRFSGKPVTTNEYHNLGWIARLHFISELAKLFQRYHSENIVLHHEINPVTDFQHMKSRAKICFWGVATSYVEETSHLDDEDKARLTFEANIFIFGRLFYCAYFGPDEPFDDRVLYDGDMILHRPLEIASHEDVWELIQRCCDEDPKNRPTIEEVIEGISAVMKNFRTD